MKKAFVIAAIVAAALGTGLHFLYDLLPNPLTALIAPINESIWEHLKLLFFPVLLAGCFLSRRSGTPGPLWTGIFTALLFMPLFLLGSYYIIESGFAYTARWLNLTLYYLTVAVGFLLAWRVFHIPAVEKYGGVLLLVVILYGSALILFTFAAPPLPIFLVLGE